LRERRQWVRLALYLCGFTILLVSMISCFGVGPKDLDLPRERIVWPPPPAPARVEYVRSFRTPRDLGIRRNWLVRFFSYLARGRRNFQMARPYAIAVTSDGKIVVADPDARSVHVYDLERTRYKRITRAAGSLLVSPVGVAADLEGRIYVSDSYRKAIFRFDPKGEWIDTLGDEGDLLRPTGLAFDRQRNRLYVTDTLGHRLVAYSTDGEKVLDLGKRGEEAGAFNYPVAVAVDPSGRLYVTDSMNFRVQILAEDGRVLRVFGKQGYGAGDFDKIKGVALDADGHVYVVEALHDVIHVYGPEGKFLTAIGGTGTGPGEFWLPTGIHIDGSGRILIADSANHRVQMLQYLGEPEGGAEL